MMGEHSQGQPGADRAVGRPGPAARMSQPASTRPRPSVLIPPVTPGAAPTPQQGRQSTTPAPSAGEPSARTIVILSDAPAAPRPETQGAAAPGAGGSGAPAAAAGPDPTSQQPASAARVARTAVRSAQGPRAARVYLTHVDPWSVMKQAFLLSLALAVVILVASAALWFALDSAGVLDAITRTATDVGGESGASVSNLLDFSRVMGFGLLLAGIETVLITALATLFAFLYNLSVGIGGGLEITLSEDDY